jgi:hypothetical protein
MHNSYQELSKADKKTVRSLIDKGIAEDFSRGMQHFDSLIQQLKNGPDTPQEQYHQLYKEIQHFDKQLGRKYDRFTGSHFLDILGNQIFLGLINESELDVLNPDAKDHIVRHVNFLRSL